MTEAEAEAQTETDRQRQTDRERACLYVSECVYVCVVCHHVSTNKTLQNPKPRV